MSTNSPDPHNPITRLLELIVREAEGFSETARIEATNLLTEILGGPKAEKTPTTPLEIAVAKLKAAQAEADLVAGNIDAAKAASDKAAADQAAIDKAAAEQVAAERAAAQSAAPSA